MSRFPLVKLPKRVVYVDDDGTYLDALRKVMPKNSREFRESPKPTLEALLGEAPYWRAIEFLLASSHDAREKPGGEALWYVKRYFQEWRRFHLTGVLIVDFNMPGMNGVDLVRELGDFPARRVLLTGVADAEVAVKAFNQGLIQKFIPKSTPDLYRHIITITEEMHRSVCEHFGHLVRSTIDAEQVELLHERSVVEALTRKVDELGWLEYIVVGRPFGLLGLAHDGPLQWLQLETPRSLADHAEALADYGYSDADVQAVRDCTALSAHELLTALGLPKKNSTIDADSLCAGPDVYCAVLDLPTPVRSAKEHGIDDIMSVDELMRSLLRDAVAAYKSSDDDLEDEAVPMPLQQALAVMARTAAASEFHKQALQSEMARRAVNPALAVLIEIALVQALKTGGGHGRQR